MTDEATILQALHNEGDIPMENAMEVNESPLQEPTPLPEEQGEDTSTADTHTEATTDAHPDPVQAPTTPEEPLDVPEQHIDETATPEPPPVQIPLDQALLAADALLTSADNFIAIGAGFFVKINKHEDFLDFEEIVQVIDEQNEANVKRMRLSEGEKDMLRPLLALVIQKRALNVSPEKQLIGVAASILISKVQVMFMIRKENAMLTDRIRMIVRQEMRQAQTQATPSPTQAPTETDAEDEEPPTQQDSSTTQQAEPAPSSAQSTTHQA